jgi:hypothetical protein
MLDDYQLVNALSAGKIDDVSFLAKLLRIAVNDPALMPTDEELKELREDVEDHFDVSAQSAIWILRRTKYAGNDRQNNEWQRIQDAQEGNWE